MDEGTELKRETMADIVTRYNRIAAGFAAHGWNAVRRLVYRSRRQQPCRRRLS
jgi:hypothetical protein